MREQDHLQSVVRRVAGEVPVDVHHGAAELLTIASDGELCARISSPFWKGLGKRFLVPRKEKITELVIVDCVCVRWIGNPNVIRFVQVARVRNQYSTAAGERPQSAAAVQNGE